MKTVSSVGSLIERSVTWTPAWLGGVDDAGQQALRRWPAGITVPSTTLALGGALARLASELVGEAGRGRRSAWMRTTLSAPIDRFRAAGVSRARMRAVVHDRHTVAEQVGLLHVVGGEQDRLALGVQLLDDLPERDAALRDRGRRWARRGTGSAAGA